MEVSETVDVFITVGYVQKEVFFMVRLMNREKKEDGVTDRKQLLSCSCCTMLAVETTQSHFDQMPEPELPLDNRKE